MRRTMKAKAMKPGQEFKVEGRWYRLRIQGLALSDAMRSQLSISRPDRKI